MLRIYQLLTFPIITSTYSARSILVVILHSSIQPFLLKLLLLSWIHLQCLYVAFLYLSMFLCWLDLWTCLLHATTPPEASLHTSSYCSSSCAVWIPYVRVIQGNGRWLNFTLFCCSCLLTFAVKCFAFFWHQFLNENIVIVLTYICICLHITQLGYCIWV